MIRQAEACEAQGRWRHAAELRLKIAQKTLGDKHSDTFKAMYALANIYAQKGLLRMAATLQIQALSRQKDTIGNDHLDTAHGKHHLAGTYLKQRRLQEAEDLELQVISLRKRVLGETSVDTLWSTHQLALIYHEQGRLTEAQQLDQQVQQEKQKHLPSKEHPSEAQEYPPAIYERITQDKPEISELEQHAMTTLARAMRDAVSEDTSTNTPLLERQDSQ
ncbi:hypothetical protein FRC07_012946, partial [Ceratobasidium sp. 392]